MSKSYLIVGSDSCIGYALCKRMTLKRELCVYGINTRFSHYGNQSFKYALNRNVYDEVELKKKECRRYLHKNVYNAIFWCDELLSEHTYTNIQKRTAEFIKNMDGIHYQRIFFFMKKSENMDINRLIFPVENVCIIHIPNVFGIYQDIKDIIPRIILNKEVEEYIISEAREEFISAWNLADEIINNNYTDLRKFIFSVRLKDLVVIFDEIKNNSTPDISACRVLLQRYNEREVKDIIYNMYEALEFYMSNKMYYMEEFNNRKAAEKNFAESELE